MNDFGVVVLAAGLGKRMKSSFPKVLHSLGGRPLLLHTVNTVTRLGPKRIAVVVGHGAEAVRQACHGQDIAWIVQERQLGTGHAVRCAQDEFQHFTGDFMILSGDVPLISVRTLRAMLQSHRESGAVMTLLTACLEDPTGYGRVVRGIDGEVTGVVEERDATDAQKEIQEVNAGIYVSSPQFLFPALAALTNHNEQGEYYLPDVVTIALKERKKIGTVQVEHPREVMGVNTREELAAMEKTLQEKINRHWMQAGVTLKDPQTTYIDDGVTIGKDTIVGPNTHLRGKTTVGERCLIDGTAYLTDVQIGNEVHLRFSVVLTQCKVDDQSIIGPFAHLRPGTSLGRNVHIGNFVEAKETVIGDGTKANHLTYLGDVTIGRETNIGAGTITCNYDGFRKYRTSIGDRVQVGSDSTLVAPISVGNDAYVATATTVRHDIPAGALVYNERHERVREGWTEQKRQKMKRAKE